MLYLRKFFFFVNKSRCGKSWKEPVTFCAVRLATVGDHAMETDPMSERAVGQSAENGRSSDKQQTSVESAESVRSMTPLSTLKKVGSGILKRANTGDSINSEGRSEKLPQVEAQESPAAPQKPRKPWEYGSSKSLRVQSMSDSEPPYCADNSTLSGAGGVASKEGDTAPPPPLREDNVVRARFYPDLPWGAPQSWGQAEFKGQTFLMNWEFLTCFACFYVGIKVLSLPL